MNNTSDTPAGRGDPAPGQPGGESGAAAPGGERRVVGYRILDDKPVEERKAEAKARSIARRRTLVERLYQFVDYAFFVLYGLLGIRLALGLLAASPGAGFVRFINGLTQPFYGPFVDIVPALELERGVFELSIVICVLAYLLLHVAVRGLLHVVLGTRRSASA